MNRKDKEIAIALACGAKWQEVPAQSGEFYNSLSEEERNFSDQLHPKRILSFTTYDFQSPICAPLPFPDSNGDVVSIPDYFNDLNAMHEAVKTKDLQKNWDEYLLNLAEVAGHKRTPGSERNEHLYACADAPAAQRAEAFGITLSLWKP